MSESFPQGTKRPREAGSKIPAGTRPLRKKQALDSGVNSIQKELNNSATKAADIPLPSTSVMEVQGQKRPYEKDKVKWLTEIATPEQREKFALNQAKKLMEGKGKKAPKKRAKKYAKKYSGGGVRGMGGTNIVYPNVVGRGAYSLSGGLSWGDEDSWFRGSIGGYYDSNNSTVVQGSGGYKIKKNSIFLGEGQGPPHIQNLTNGPVVIRHREYLGDMTVPTGAPSPFDIFFQQVINPGNPQMFPWLSQIAANFQEWDALGILFELKTMASDYTANVSMGTIFAATDYNAIAVPPTNKMQLENMEFSQSCKPSCSILMPIECDPRKNVATHLFIAPNLDYNNGDPQFYDLGQVFLGSQGLPNSGGVVGTIAEIWVSYEIVFFKPKIPSLADSPSFGGLQAGFYFQNQADNQPWGLIANQTPFVGNNTAITLANAVLTLPPIVGQNYIILVSYNGDTMATTTPIGLPGFTFANCIATTDPSRQFFPGGLGAGLLDFIDTNMLSSVTVTNVAGLMQALTVTISATADATHLPTITVGTCTFPGTISGMNGTILVFPTPLTFSGP